MFIITGVLKMSVYEYTVDPDDKNVPLQYQDTDLPYDEHFPVTVSYFDGHQGCVTVGVNDSSGCSRAQVFGMVFASVTS
jgi:hypothetical protein